MPLGPGGKLMHAEIKIGDSIVMLVDEFPGMKGPKALGGCPTTMHLYVEDADAAASALRAGLQRLLPVVQLD